MYVHDTKTNSGKQWLRWELLPVDGRELATLAPGEDNEIARLFWGEVLKQGISLTDCLPLSVNVAAK